MFDFPTPKTPDVAMAESVTFNFDVTDFSSMVHESDRSTSRTIQSYQNLMTEAMGHSNGVLTPDATLVLEAANDHIGSKILKALEAIKAWVIKTAKNFIAKIQAMVMSDDKVISKIKPAVEEKLKAGKLKGFEVSMYEYNLDAVHPEKAVESWMNISDALRDNISSFEKNPEALSSLTKEVQDLTNDFITIKIAYAAGVHATTPDDVVMTAQKLLRGNGQKKSKPFSMDFFEDLQKFGTIRKTLDMLFKTMEDQVDTVIKTSKDLVKDSVSTAADNDQKVAKSEMIGYVNAQKRVLGKMLETAIKLTNLKLQAAVEHAHELKKACIMANNYKPVKESFDPYEPYLDMSI